MYIVGHQNYFPRYIFNRHMYHDLNHINMNHEQGFNMDLKSFSADAYVSQQTFIERGSTSSPFEDTILFDAYHTYQTIQINKADSKVKVISLA